jgi:hypothetical protein
MCQGMRTVVSFAALLLSMCGTAWAGISPIALTSGSFNQDVVVENTAPAPVIPGGYTTASMDNGIGNTADSWYEEGYNSAAPGTGLPQAGSTFTSQSASNHRYTMAPSYKTNDAVLLDSTLTTATFPGKRRQQRRHFQLHCPSPKWRY